MKVDYIIVGLGLAGLAFAEKLYQHEKTFLVFEDDSQTSSLVAGGVYNPVILKRFTPAWKAKEQLDLAIPFYEHLEQKLHINFDFKLSTRKVFQSIEDQNNWYIASDKPVLSEFMNSSILNERIDGLKADFGFGEVLKTGRLDTHLLVDSYRHYLVSKNRIRFQKFDYSSLEMGSILQYQDVKSSKIVFSEGYGIKKNPFFNYLPLNGTKGELLTIHAPQLKVDFLVKSSLFLLPLGHGLYKVGATFNWTDKSSKASKEGRDELIEKLDKVIDVPYKVVNQTAGIRPTVKDRRPLVGHHPVYTNLAVLNGLGTRGVMISPWAATQLYYHLEEKQPLDFEIQINRFASLYSDHTSRTS